MTTVGIDLSINSTGVCVNRDGKCTYYIIIPSNGMTKRMKEFHSNRVILKPYEKHTVEGSYADKERIKSRNIYNIVEEIMLIVRRAKPDRCIMEGVSYGSSGSVVDLAGLQYILRYQLSARGIGFHVVTPMELKKRATGNGNADKDEMVFAWKKCDISLPQSVFEGLKKVDDIADAYFLSRME